MTLSLRETRKIFQNPRLSDDEASRREGWLAGVLNGSGYELKGWPDFLDFVHGLLLPLNYEKEFTRWVQTNEWLVSEEGKAAVYVLL